MKKLIKPSIIIISNNGAASTLENIKVSDIVLKLYIDIGNINKFADTVIITDCFILSTILMDFLLLLSTLCAILLK